MKHLRKQYHFRLSEQGLLAWDVHKLIELAKTLPVENILLENIQELNERYWYSYESDEATCRSIALHAKHIQTCDLRFPILLDFEGRVMDGMHRVCKAFLLDKKTILARRFDAPVPAHFVGVEPKDLDY